MEPSMGKPINFRTHYINGLIEDQCASALRERIWGLVRWLIWLVVENQIHRQLKLTNSIEYAARDARPNEFAEWMRIK